MNRKLVMTFRLLSFVAVVDSKAGVAPREKPTPDARKVSGKVRAVEGNRLRPRKAVLQGKDATYRIVLDEKGRSLTKVMHGQKTEVWGVMTEKGGVTRLQVLDYTDERMTAGHELWRHMRCSACVVTPALMNSTVPRVLEGAEPRHGRYWGHKERLATWTADDRFLWLASDGAVYQVDLETKKLLKAYGRTEGLPDQPVHAFVLTDDYNPIDFYRSDEALRWRNRTAAIIGRESG